MEPSPRMPQSCRYRQASAPSSPTARILSWISADTSHPKTMATCGLISYEDASPAVRAVYDDIMATRQTDYINNFWRAIAHDPVLLKRTWESVKQIMGPGGALDPLVKEMLY